MSQPGSDTGWEHVVASDGKGAPVAQTYTPEEWAQWSVYQYNRMQQMSAQLTQQQQALDHAQQQHELQQAQAQQQAFQATQFHAAQAAPTPTQPLGAPAVMPPMGQPTFDATAYQQMMQLQQRINTPKKRKIDSPLLPDPAGDVLRWERAVDEFLAGNTDCTDQYSLCKALKDALPEDLQVLATERFTIPDMQHADAVATLVSWIKSRYEELPDEETTKILRGWHDFRRSGTDLRLYLDQYDHQLVLLTRVHKKPSDAEIKDYLLLKADLPKTVHFDIRTALSRLCSCLGQADYTYAQLKSELLLASKRPDLLQRRVNVVESSRQELDAVVPVHFGRKGDKGKGKGKQPCWAYQTGSCRFGRDCRFSHSSGDRSHTPAPWDNRGGNAGDRSRSRGRHERSPRHDARSRSTSTTRGREACRDFVKGECTRGDKCIFSHEQGRNPYGGWGNGRGRSPDDRGKGFGAERDRSRSPRSQGKGKGKDKHNKATRARLSHSRSPPGQHRGSASRSPRPAPRR